jgi:hypothetical protein
LTTANKKSLLLCKRPGDGWIERSTYHEASIEDRLVLGPKSGVTPVLEVIDFFRYQKVDSLSQLFFKKESVKTHFGEHSFDIIQHGKETYSLIKMEFIISPK